MRILVIPDIHGRTGWVPVVNNFLAGAQAADRVVFLGDYNDSFTVPDAVMLDNFIDVLLLKQQEPERVVLLLGNHCVPYLLLPRFQCSGFRPTLAPALHILFKHHRHLFQVAYQAGPYLFTHAGVSEMWLKENGLAIRVLCEMPATVDNLPAVLNKLLTTEEGQRRLWQVSGYNGGRDRVDGPLWVRPAHLRRGLLPGIIQVVGHTPLPGISWDVKEATQTGVVFTDCHDRQPTEYLTLELPG
ncbi:metallophosphoesterase [Hymenobacter glacieicola]|uniref:Calcineurin-like phosphoesterase domain-containing protein n=1 Tax=Hymenobacter glacieicola TaxID=1562124 RepID=A0ABQ1WNN3_9BACT|nr:metallophosphoesterase [Hymenobacter glacieicola]GGG35794.1 hypothetical protein GCM10011378_10070 [Hymenobacter glacieicola]